MRALLLCVLLAACSSKRAEDPGPGCPEVVDNMLAVMKQGMAGHDSVELANRKQMIDQCEQRKMSANQRRCLRDAKDLTGLASCRPVQQQPAKSPPSPAPMPSQPPSGSAGSPPPQSGPADGPPPASPTTTAG